jgi:Flp pilus assembly pilin Flp
MRSSSLSSVVLIAGLQALSGGINGAFNAIIAQL